MTRKQKRLSSIGAILVVLAAAVGLVLSAMSDSVAFFASPTDVMSQVPGNAQRIRLGGLVETGSIDREAGEVIRFRVTDSVESVAVVYKGLLPDLFREGQGVVTEGTLGPDRIFVADTVLAKHDESYMPKEVVDDMKARGLWQEGKGMPTASGATPPASPVAPAAGGAGT
ncbi:cytochrome c-type biogenesis protein CcmE [Aureimonas sp. SA4125]|uniref:cytochrome c maturation protein CcmE n=1 Tax=Aureimonas sp. SA4125 TaxID=2826993 RepID=UPI001CC686EF|nr:cytochrome c maturation protein CcmE [Aureimonas sp. SA4125]BDA83709.1 cytochrome c-type biogenesis protein CcmE [Aureimonas sp. SA4125]